MDVVALQADLVGGDGIVGDTTLLGLAGPDDERREVPGAGDDFAFEPRFTRCKVARWQDKLVYSRFPLPKSFSQGRGRTAWTDVAAG